MTGTAASKIKAVIRDLERCAKQNESDAFIGRDAGAVAVAGEQRRMIRVLKALLS